MRAFRAFVSERSAVVTITKIRAIPEFYCVDYASNRLYWLRRIPASRDHTDIHLDNVEGLRFRPRIRSIHRIGTRVEAYRPLYQGRHSKLQPQ